MFLNHECTPASPKVLIKTFGDSQYRLRRGVAQFGLECFLSKHVLAPSRSHDSIDDLFFVRPRFALKHHASGSIIDESAMEVVQGPSGVQAR